MRNNNHPKNYENNLLNTLQPMLDEYHKYLNEQDMEGVISMIHIGSPAQTHTRQLLSQVFDNYKVQNDLIDVKYIGNDDSYVYIKMKQKVTKLEGPEFQNNINISLVALKMEKGKWKVWSMMPLEVSLI